MERRKFTVNNIAVNCEIRERFEDKEEQKKSNQKEVCCSFNLQDKDYKYWAIVTDEMINEDPKTFELYLSHRIKKEMERISTLSPS